MHISRQKSITSRSIKKTGALIVIMLKLSTMITLNFVEFWGLRHGIAERCYNRIFQEVVGFFSVFAAGFLLNRPKLLQDTDGLWTPRNEK